MIARLPGAIMIARPLRAAMVAPLSTTSTTCRCRAGELLRGLQNRTLSRLRTRHVSVKYVSCVSKRNLKQMVADVTFR